MTFVVSYHSVIGMYQTSFIGYGHHCFFMQGTYTCSYLLKLLMSTHIYSSIALIIIYYTFRVLHLALTVALQYWLMRDLEKLCGSTRLSLIYLGSGMVGNLASAIFVPYRAEVGPAGAHFGLLALSMVEVIHQWPSLKYPEMAILKIVGITAVLFLAGLLPWVDNYAHLFGFIFGFLLSYALQVLDSE